MKWDSGFYDQQHSFVTEYGMGLVEFVPVDRAQKILDLGCGTGALTAKLAQQSDFISGVDASPEMITRAQEPYLDLDFEVMDTLELPFEHKWDLVFSNAVFNWIPDHDQLLRRIQCTLKLGGKLVCEFVAYDNIAAIEDAFRDVLQELGRTYRFRFSFPTVAAFSASLRENGFSVGMIYDFERPAPLNDSELGLR